MGLKCFIKRHRFKKLMVFRQIMTIEKHVKCIMCDMHIFIIHPNRKNYGFYSEPVHYIRKPLESSNRKLRTYKQIESYFNDIKLRSNTT